MKKIIILSLISFLVLSINAQNYNSIMRNRNKEIKKAERSGASPAEIREINSFYAPLLEAAIEREKNSPSSSSKNKTYGSSISFEGNGSFQGGSALVKNGAEAYATVVMADANANLVNKLAAGEVGKKFYAPDLNIGLEGIVINRYRHQELTVKITGINPGNNYDKSFLLGKGESVKNYLLPGEYRAQIKGSNDRNSSYTEFSVSPEKTHYASGGNFYWWLSGGNSW